MLLACLLRIMRVSTLLYSPTGYTIIDVTTTYKEFTTLGERTREDIETAVEYYRMKHAYLWGLVVGNQIKPTHIEATIRNLQKYAAARAALDAVLDDVLLNRMRRFVLKTTQVDPDVEFEGETVEEG